ncbi:MAG TPA: peroxidase-related enzyme [Candidatus Polarisedimenticolia bacterium]|nr:peroxidase-related enzyme [Candidatus Polarisedimenticolia bacterium]
MYLKEIETRPAKGLTALALRRLRNAGEAVPDILHLFRFKKRATDHLVRFTEEVMRGPSPLSPGTRELIGAYVSKKNQYCFCSDAHAAAAAQFMDAGLVDQVLCDLETSGLDEKHKALFRYVGKLTENPAAVTAADISVLKEAGWSEEAIYDALTVAAVFRFYNTWNAGAGVRKMASTDYVYSGKVLKQLGYCMDFSVSRLLKIAASTLRTMVKSA